MGHGRRLTIGVMCAAVGATVAAAPAAAGERSAIAAAAPAKAPTAGAPEPRKLRRPAPSWLTDAIRRDIRRSGVKGRAMPEDLIFKSCPGVAPTVPRTVQAGTCLVAPSGCTANYVYYNGATRQDLGGLRPAGADGKPMLPPFKSNGRNWFLGTAGHCLKAGSVLAQVAPTGVYVPNSDAGGIADIGTTHKRINGGIGKDFGTIRIRSGFGVMPANPIGAPKGVATSCIPAPIDYYGHGYHFAIAQGKGGAGTAFWPAATWYTWAGTSFRGDSGSGVSLPTLAAAGNLTHGARVGGAGLVPAPIGWGTRMTRILSFLGRGFHLVNADGTLSRETTGCAGMASPWDFLFR